MLNNSLFSLSCLFLSTIIANPAMSHGDNSDLPPPIIDTDETIAFSSSFLETLPPPILSNDPDLLPAPILPAYAVKSTTSLSIVEQIKQGVSLKQTSGPQKSQISQEQPLIKEIKQGVELKKVTRANTQIKKQVNHKEKINNTLSDMRKLYGKEVITERKKLDQEIKNLASQLEKQEDPQLKWQLKKLRERYNDLSPTNIESYNQSALRLVFMDMSQYIVSKENAEQLEQKRERSRKALFMRDAKEFTQPNLEKRKQPEWRWSKKIKAFEPNIAIKDPESMLVNSERLKNIREKANSLPQEWGKDEFEKKFELKDKEVHPVILSGKHLDQIDSNVLPSEFYEKPFWQRNYKELINEGMVYRFQISDENCGIFEGIAKTPIFEKLRFGHPKENWAHSENAKKFWDARAFEQKEWQDYQKTDDRLYIEHMDKQLGQILTSKDYKSYMSTFDEYLKYMNSNSDNEIYQGHIPEMIEQQMFNSLTQTSQNIEPENYKNMHAFFAPHFKNDSTKLDGLHEGNMEFLLTKLKEENKYYEYYEIHKLYQALAVHKPELKQKSEQYYKNGPSWFSSWRGK